MLKFERTHRLDAILMAMAALPVALSAIPGFSDLPGHLARLHIMSSSGRGGPIDQWYVSHLRLVGNLGVDIPVLALTHLMPVDWAVRLVTSLIAPLMVMGILMLGRAAHGRTTAGAMIALPFVFSYPYAYGFLNYCLGAGLALIAAARWYKRPNHDVISTIGWTIVACLLWLVHTVGWGIFLIFVGGAELAQSRSIDDVARRALRSSPLLLPVLPMLLWRGGVSGSAYAYVTQEFLQTKLITFATVLKGISKPFDLAMLVLIGIAGLAALAFAGWRSLDRRLALTALMLALAVFVMPTTVLTSWGADMRLVPIAMIAGLLAIGPVSSFRSEKVLLLAGLALFAVRAAVLSATWLEQSRTLEARLKVIDRVPRGARLGYVHASRTCGPQWKLTPDRELAGYAIVRRDVFSNTLFRNEGAEVALPRSAQDSSMWRDGSQDVAALCPSGQLNEAALSRKLVQMAAGSFDHVWIAGARSNEIKLPIGYRVLFARGTDVLIKR